MSNEEDYLMQYQGDDPIDQILRMMAPPEEGTTVTGGTNADMKAELQKRLGTGHDHWVIISYDAPSQRLMKRIEDRFYAGREANEDFTLFISVDRTNPFIKVLGIALAHKRRMSMGELAMFTSEDGDSCPNPDHDHRVRGLEDGDVDRTPVIFPVQHAPTEVEKFTQILAQAWAGSLLGEVMPS